MYVFPVPTALNTTGYLVLLAVPTERKIAEIALQGKDSVTLRASKHFLQSYNYKRLVATYLDINGLETDAV